MMPLSMVKPGETNTIKKVGGKEETRKFLENLGFVTGGEVTVVSEIEGNLIVNVKDSRVAIGKDMANTYHGVSRRIIKERARMLMKTLKEIAVGQTVTVKEIAW